MSNNAIPDPERRVLALAEDCADGCAELEDVIPLKLIREADLRTAINALKGEPGQTPVVTGLLYQFKQAEGLHTQRKTERKNKDEAGRLFLGQVRAALIPILGRDPSTEWELAGFGAPGTNSNAVPATQEGRLQCLASVAIYLTQHPTYEVAAGGPRPEVTATKASALHQQLSDARAAANLAAQGQTTALAAKSAALEALRQLLIALVDELQLRLTADDPRWEVFGLNIPANPRAPDPANGLELSHAGPKQILAEWEPGTRSDDDRILIQVVGVDDDYREYGKSGGDGQEVIKNLPTGATVKIKIIALNGALEASDGPEGQIVVL